jgi:hypothetical protein
LIKGIRTIEMEIETINGEYDNIKALHRISAIPLLDKFILDMEQEKKRLLGEKRRLEKR